MQHPNKPRKNAMKPIQERAEVALVQALKCVQFRLPNQHHLKPKAYTCALALRYGLLGAAAAFHTLENANRLEEREVKSLFQYWPLMVTEHFCGDLCERLPFEANDSTACVVGRLAGVPMKVAMALRKQYLPVQRVLEISAEVFFRDHRYEITSEAWLFGKQRATKLFNQVAIESVHYSLCFFERRRAGLEEVSEIALLGE
jgi:hypothetical protein